MNVTWSSLNITVERAVVERRLWYVCRGHKWLTKVDTCQSFLSGICRIAIVPEFYFTTRRLPTRLLIQESMNCQQYCEADFVHNIRHLHHQTHESFPVMLIDRMPLCLHQASRSWLSACEIVDPHHFSRSGFPKTALDYDTTVQSQVLVKISVRGAWAYHCDVVLLKNHGGKCSC